MRRSLLVSLLLGIALGSDGFAKSTADTTKGEERQGRKAECSPIVPILLHQGVYFPDPRFNAFAEGVMVNTVVEMKRKQMDPLYFRVYSQGVIEHVPTRGKRETNEFQRTPRQVNSALGGGVIRGLTNIKRFGNAEVQTAGNTTLIRSHWLMGPLYLIIDFRGDPLITRVKTELQAVQFDTLTTIDRFGAEMKDFQLYSPLFDYMAYFGNRTLGQQQTAELVVKHLFSNASFMATLLRNAFEIASYDKIIPQYGADLNYSSVLDILFNGQRSRSSRLSILQQYQDIHQQLQEDQGITLNKAESLHQVQKQLKNIQDSVKGITDTEENQSIIL